mgnify:CR=1 FL=1
MKARICFRYVPRRNEPYEGYCSRKEMESCPVSKKVDYAKSGEEFFEEFVDGEDARVRTLWCDVVMADSFAREFSASAQ